jgi:hypothetical protein
MAGLFDNIFGGSGGMYADLMTPEQQAQIRKQSMLQMAAKLLESSGPSPVRRSLGQTIGGALSSGAEAMQSGQANAVQQMLMRQKLEEAKIERERAAQLSSIFGAGAAVPVTPEAAINAPGAAAGPTVGRAATINTMPAPVASDRSTQAARYRQAAGLFASDPAKAKAYMDIADQLDPREKFSTTPQFGRSADGTPISYVLSESGGMKLLSVQQSPDFNYQDMGGYVSVRDKRTNKEVERIKKSMSPSEFANYQRGSYSVQDTDQGKMYVPTTPGKPAIPVVGPGGAPVKSAAGGGQPSQDELQTATLLARVSIAEQQIGEAAKANQGAAAPGVFNPLAPRAFKSEERKQVEDAQDEFLDAALTLSTGAAYTQEQFDAAKRTYFPTALDDAQTIKDKANRRKNVIESARLRAGRAAGSIPAMPESRFNQSPSAAPIQGLGTGTVDLGNYFNRRP